MRPDRPVGAEISRGLSSCQFYEGSAVERGRSPLAADLESKTGGMEVVIS